MRIGEVLALKREDVDPINGVVKVINGKNGVSRYIPVSDSLKMVLSSYAETIDMSDEDKPFFISSYTGGHLTYDAMKYMFPRCLRRQIYTWQMEKHPTSTPFDTRSVPEVWRKCWTAE